MSENTDATRREQVNKAFVYYPPKPENVPKFEQIREAARQFALLLIELTPECRERAIALTRIEEGVFWANAGLARNQP